MVFLSFQSGKFLLSHIMTRRLTTSVLNVYRSCVLHSSSYRPVSLVWSSKSYSHYYRALHTSQPDNNATVSAKESVTPLARQLQSQIKVLSYN
jgi:hypothetical protein